MKQHSTNVDSFWKLEFSKKIENIFKRRNFFTLEEFKFDHFFKAIAPKATPDQIISENESSFVERITEV
jgi:hypothetical protein